MSYKNKSRYKMKNGKFEHIEVIKKRGDYYKSGFHNVHHKNRNIRDNRSENLELMYNSEHRLHHYIDRKKKKLKKYY